MPGETSRLETFINGRLGNIRQSSVLSRFKTIRMSLTSLRKLFYSGCSKHVLTGFSATGIWSISHTTVFAQSTSLLSSEALRNFSLALHTPDVLMLAAFGGAMSFALLSASWMIRERARITEENNKLKNNISKLKALSDRNEALVAIDGQCTLVWGGLDEEVSVTGKLSSSTHAPTTANELLNFKSWLEEESAMTLERHARALRNHAENFDTIIETRSGYVLEAQGRTSGASAYIRLSELANEREEFAKLKTEHERTLSKFQIIEALFEKIPMPVWMENADGKLSWVNTAYSNALDISTPSDAIENQSELFDSEQRNIIQNNSQANALFNEILPATVSGDRKKLEVFNIKTEAGNMGMALDQSATENIRTTLHETVEGHARMLDQLATAVAIFDKSEKLIFYNSGFQQLWKMEPALLENNPSNVEILDAIRDKNILPFNPDWKKWRDNHLEIYRAIEPVEEWWHLLDGQTLRVIITPRNEGGVTWIFENVTEKLELESSYNSLMRIQGETLDHLIEAVAVFGSDGNLKLFNPALKEIWQENGLEAEEGIHIAKVIEVWSEAISNEEDLAKILGKVTGFDDTRDNFSGRMELRNGNTLQYSLVPLPEGQSMLTLTDVTASVNFERALKDRAEALEESDRLKNKFIQHVSYDLRAPLTSISGFGEMLATGEMGELNRKQSEYLDHINEASDVLKRIIDDILDLASFDAGTMSLDLETLNLDESVEHVINNFASAVEEKQIRFETNINHHCKTIIADRKRLIQILENLLSNAVTFSPDGSTVSINAERKESTYEIKVIDQGPGVSEDKHHLIFNRFETSSQDGSRLGTGLGLSIVRSLAQLHGGSINIENSENNGACFTLSLPINPAAYVNDAEQIA